MAAPKNNTNARKWTEEKVRSYLAAIERLAQDPTELFLGKALEKLGLYRDIWLYWQRKFSDKEDLMEKMDVVKLRFEVNVFKAGMNGQISAGYAILCLKKIHGWSENGYVDEIEAKEDYRIIPMYSVMPGHRLARAA
jgi:hypothetical protein